MMRRENQAVQAMLSFNLETTLTENSAQGQIEENIDQVIINQAEDEETENSAQGQIEENIDQDIINQAEDEESYSEFENIQEAVNEGEI
jgi:hypothetical protein